jgi:hypothetical protein
MPIAESTFTVTSFDPVDWSPDIITGLPTGHANLLKTFTGAIQGRAVTQFSYSYDESSNTGTYLALESFEGLVDGLKGAVNVVHSSTVEGRTAGTSSSEFFKIVPGSGTSELSGISGAGALWVEADGSHHFRLDYGLPR